MRRRIVLVIAVLGAASLLVSQVPVGAHSAHRDLWINGTVAKARNGDEVKLWGSGVWNEGDHSRVHIRGAFVHRTRRGEVVARGFWKATQVKRFTSWGTSPDFAALEGGRLVLKVTLVPLTGEPTNFNDFTVDCLVGDRVPEGAVEGVTFGPFQKVVGKNHRVTAYFRI